MVTRDSRFVGERIAMLIADRNISESKVSRELGKSKGYIQNITAGRSLPSLDMLFEICDYFNITVTEFFDTGIPHPEKLHQLYVQSSNLPPDKLDTLITLSKQFSENK